MKDRVTAKLKKAGKILGITFVCVIAFIAASTEKERTNA